MKLTYSGPKALISAHGISFDVAKDDKYIYLSMLAELILALNHDYIEDKRYTFLASDKPLNSDEILSQIRACDTTLDEDITQQKYIAENEITDELERARNNHLLSGAEREVLTKNITMMKDYRINRAINKAIYYSGLNSLAMIIKKGHVNTLSAPMIPKFMHVLHSLQGTLQKLHPSINSTIDIYEHQGQITVNLLIKFT